MEAQNKRTNSTQIGEKDKDKGGPKLIMEPKCSGLFNRYYTRMCEEGNKKHLTL